MATPHEVIAAVREALAGTGCPVPFGVLVRKVQAAHFDERLTRSEIHRALHSLLRQGCAVYHPRTRCWTYTGNEDTPRPEVR